MKLLKHAIVLTFALFLHSVVGMSLDLPRAQIADPKNADLDTLHELTFQSEIHDLKYQPKEQVKAANFIWAPCDEKANYIFKLQDLTIGPDPIVLPGNISVTGTATLSQTVSAPIKAVVVLKKSFAGTWVKIPCINQLGSCTYDDVCDPSFCPLKKGALDVKEETLPLNIKAPGGSYEATGNFYHGDTLLACYKTRFIIA